MAKKKLPAKRAPKPEPAGARPLAGRWQWILAAVLLIAYAVPLASPNASIQWDAVDVHHSAQRYFAERALRGDLPFWTPYVFSGFPFLADPQTGAWYPGNWPFFLAGAGPKALEAELAFHALLAAAGMFLLLRRWFGGCAATAGALSYALGGFFAGHSSHIGMFESAALFPWLMVALFFAVEGRFRLGVFCGTLAGGFLILAGHFQTALYSFSAVGVLVLAIAFFRRGERARKAFGFLALAVAGAALLSAIQTLPGLELAARSIRASANYSASSEGALDLRSLVTTMLPDYLGAASGAYRGPGDVTQYYFYSGFLLLPLALLGLRNRTARTYALCLAIPALLYMAGPGLGVFRLIAWLPGFRSVRAPVHAWFVVALALAMLAAAGVDWLESRWRWAGAIAVAVLAIDLCNANLWANPLAYAHRSFDSLYGMRLEMARSRVVPAVPTLTRFDAPDKLAALGPLNHPLDLRLETTYGYNPLVLSNYLEFREAFARNPKLRDSLAVSRVLDMASGDLRDNPSRLPRAYFPKDLLVVSNEVESRRALETLDPPRQAVLFGPLGPVKQDPVATVTIQAAGEQTYELAYKAATPSVLRLALPYFPGWEATADGARCTVLRADHAMTAIVVPAGEKRLRLRFRSTYFRTGAALSCCGILLLVGLGAAGRKRKAGSISEPAPAER
jgi:hypothetical protein